MQVQVKEQPSGEAGRVWDLPVRLSHGVLVLAILGCYATAKFGWLPMAWHFYFGYVVLGVVVFRLLWGVLGGEHARFRNFLTGPRAVLRHVRELLGDGYRPHAGHNPLGGWAALVLLLVCGVQAALGLVASDEIQWYGPWSEAVSTATMRAASSGHRILEVWLLLLIALHVSAIVFYRVLKGDALLPAMVHGRKPGMPNAWRPPAWRAWVLALVVGGGIWAALRYGVPAVTW